MTIASLDLPELQRAARHAWRVCIADPWRLVGCVILVLFATDLLTLVPGVGFLLKLALASLLFAQALQLFRLADGGGRGAARPGLMTLVHALSLPLSSQFVLVLGEWATFGIAMLFLWQVGGPDAATAFFGEPHAEATLDETLYFEFKVVLFVASAPLTFLAPAIVLARVQGIAALWTALLAALRNPGFVLVLLALDVVLEFLLSALAQPGGLGAWIYLPLLVLSLVYELALLYAVSVRVFGITADAGDARSPGADKP
ncbi:MAG TPA: hypothetical protein VMU33_08320 [Burkholderiaceae bacterium]|nr:hypothetical protein [Burkholderiaceae bacterium]